MSRFNVPEYNPRPIQSPQNALMQGLEMQRAQQGNALQQMQLQAFMQRAQQAQQDQQRAAADQGLMTRLLGMPVEGQMPQGTPGPGAPMRNQGVDPQTFLRQGGSMGGLSGVMGLNQALAQPARKVTVSKPGDIARYDDGTEAWKNPAEVKPVAKPSAVQEFEYGQQNPAFNSWQTGLKRAGATNLSVNTEKSYGGEIAQGLAKADLAALDIARSAPDRVRSATDVKRILSTGNTITGTAAEQRLWLDKALSTAGVIDGTRTQATEDLVNLLANQTLDAIKTSGLGSGQGFTDKDRQFLQDAKAGRIEINAKTLYRMADLNEKSARASIAYGNKVAARLKGNPILGTIGQDLEVQAPADLNEAIAAEARRRGLGGK